MQIYRFAGATYTDTDTDLKINNTILKNDVSYSKLSKELEQIIKI